MMTNFRLFSYDFSQFNFELPFIRIDNISSFQKNKLLFPEGFIPVSPSNAACVFGLKWWIEIVGDYKSKSVLDCGNIRYQALSALENGVGAVLCEDLDVTTTAILSQSLNKFLEVSKT